MSGGVKIKFSRMLGMLMVLINKKTVTANELAEDFNVSRRTVIRDIDALCNAGIPIYSKKGFSGGYSLVEEYGFNTSFIGSGDIGVIVDSLESLSSLFENSEIKRVSNLLRTMDGKGDKSGKPGIKDKLYIDMSLFNSKYFSEKIIDPLFSSISDFREISFICNGEEEFGFQPMTLVFKWFEWFLLGYSQVNHKYMLYRLTEISDIDYSENKFIRKESSITDIIGSLEMEFKKESINFKLAIHKSLKKEFDYFFPEGEITERHGNWYVFSAEYPNEEWIYSVFLSYGDKIKVIEPESAVNKMKKHLSKALKNYGKELL